MTKPLVVMISGKQGAGKTTLKEGLLTHFPDAIGIRFSDPLYEMHMALRDVCAWYDVPFAKKEGRLLQLLGDDWGRQIKGKDVWVNALKDRLNILMSSSYADHYIIDDLRYQNEFDAFVSNRDYDVLKLRLFAEEPVRRQRAEGWRDTVDHSSEVDLDFYERDNRFDLVIDTDGMLPETSLQCVLNFIKKDRRYEHSGTP